MPKREWQQKRMNEWQSKKYKYESTFTFTFTNAHKFSFHQNTKFVLPRALVAWIRRAKVQTNLKPLTWFQNWFLSECDWILCIEYERMCKCTCHWLMFNFQWIFAWVNKKSGCCNRHQPTTAQQKLIQWENALDFAYSFVFGRRSHPTYSKRVDHWKS